MIPSTPLRAGYALGAVVTRTALRALVFACLFSPVLLFSANKAHAETRTLKLYFVHTKERAEITFKRNGRYDQAGLNKLNRFLRDWRRNEPTRMDPELFDVLWEAYRISGARDYIHVVSAYRSPATNEMLRRTRGGQAKKSQHMLGKAVDFYIPGVKLGKLREIGFKLQGGGVGYYPQSGSPFVHFDTGNVRAWPRMSRQELARVFPDGKTLHLPPDGKPLPGYQQALAEYQSRKSRGQATAIASTGSSSRRNDTEERGGGKTLLAVLFGGADEEEDNAEAAAPVARETTTIRAVPEPQTTEPEPPAPQTLIAALPPREMPLPQAAPRPQAIIPLAEQRPIAVAVADEAVRPLALVPTPDVKPAALIPGVEVGARPDRRSATDIETALNGEKAVNSAPNGTVEGILAAAAPARTSVRDALRIPIPVAAPRDASVDRSRVEVASIPVPALRDELLASDVKEQPVTVAYAPEAVQPAETVRESVSPEILSERPEEASGIDERILAAYDTGVATTEKSSRPTVLTASVAAARTAEPEIVPVDQIDPARFGTWTTASITLTDNGGASNRPIFIQNALRAAPTEVYTNGFQKLPAPDPRRFSGNAVTFLTVARFNDGGSGGDGQPLTLRVPLTN